MGPSILQTLLREPTRSYQSIYTDPSTRPSHAPSTSSPSKRPSSLRSTTSDRSNSSAYTTAGPAWVNGQWEWSAYGARGGLTGGARSLHTPSVVGKSLGIDRRTASVRSADSQGDEAGSVRSGRSFGSVSVRTSMSAPGGDDALRRTRKKKKDRYGDGDTGSGYNVPARQRSEGDLSSQSRGSSRFDNLPPIPTSFSSSFDGMRTSRRYSSVSPSYPSSPALSATSSSQTRPSKSRLASPPSDDTTPSLTSSASSAPSSPPTTPITPHGVLPPLSLDGKPRKSKKRASTRIGQPGAKQSEKLVVTAQPESHAQRLEEMVQPAGEKAPEPTAAPPAPIPGKFYSVDELFALASSPSTTTTIPTSPARPTLARLETDNASFTTALDSPSPEWEGEGEEVVKVPRLKLTRTESEQSRIGVRGSVDLDVQSEEEGEEEESEEEEQEVAPPPQDHQEEPVLPHFVNVKRSPSKRKSKDGSSPSKSRSVEPEATYEIVRSSKSARSTLSSTDPHVRPSSPTHSDLSASSDISASSTLASTDVPDWLQRIRALGEPIQPLVSNPSPTSKSQVVPPPHWTVQQLRAQEGSGGSGRPSLGRPRSTKTLSSRANILEVMPEDAEAEAEAAAEDQELQRLQRVKAATPAWVKKGSGLAESPAGSVRTASPAPAASPDRPLSRTSSLAPSSAGSSGQGTTRRTRSMDLDRDHLKALSPLIRSTSLMSSRPGSSRTSSAKSKGSSVGGMEYDLEAIAAAASKPRGFSKLIQPPLASSLATKQPAVVAVVNQPRTPSPGRPSSLRNVALAPLFPRQVDDDAKSVSALSDLSIMSAPQLSPTRPPRNPARLSAPPPVRPIFPPSAPPSERAKSPTPSFHSAYESPEAVSPASSVVARPTPRPMSMSFSAIERPSFREPPPPAPPVSTAVASPAPSVISRTSSVQPRPLSSYLPPSTVDLAMTALAISPRADFGKQKSSRRFGLFRRSSNANLAFSSSSKQFEPSLDLVYESMDGRAFRKRLNTEEVLVEAITVGVDRWDRERVWQLAKTGGAAGWVPGRAVYGKVVEVGSAVSRVKKGDLVWGLSPLKRSGALASLVILPRDNVSLAPTSLPVELAAALPAAATSAMLIMQSLCNQLPKGSKVLVLNAHQGVGYFCLQLAHHYRPGVSGSRDLWMVAQCPLHVLDAETICREAGATDMLRDEPLAALNSIHEGSFDAVIDTIGGRRLYDASRRILHSSGSFITTVGDELTASSTSSSNDYQTSIRSLRRAFFKKDKKSIAYWKVEVDGTDAPEAVRDTLDKVREVAEAGALKPRMGKVLPMSEARRTFETNEADEDATVVRVKEV
ncbi:hypothetical protein NBRC10512_006936 [Rhodotorula toruloides]|uniref:RHTO0S02e11848g1_1 n=2 Tax=Rhodotorula toruloides TaxID=5286 RepID=A0A061AP97_RHOTO|nr:NADPH:quinone reductase Zn-dependent oxidoreductase [Rhodotorula toruloides NP11]EMS23518.1 NADPH:quinone reductase Zn-dependent oxidoreductase [Rhodotorula toruloides NP11]CDR37196.1 RHTO0S02e11848g1_1 [Rhodotorula toruloides]